MAFYAECLPEHGSIRSITVYAVEGEVGCRVRELRTERAVAYGSSCTPAEFIAHRRHLGAWEITGLNKGDSNGNSDDREGSGPAEVDQGIYGKKVLSGRPPYRNILLGG